MKKIKTIKYGGYSLEVINHVGENVPTSINKITLKSADKKALAIAIKNNIPALLIGETGTGKTSAIKEIAYLRKQKYTRISLTGYTTPDELIGSKSVKNGQTYYENGILTKAMLEGHICVLDELNAISPDSSFIIHSLLDDERKVSLPNGDVIIPHKDFRVFATINPDYEGTKSLNRAFLDRFGILIYVDILSPRLEEKLLKDRTGVNEVLIKKLVAVAWLNRKAYSEQKTLTLISTRGLIQTCDLIKEGLTAKEAYKIAIVNKARTDEKNAFMDFYNIIFKTDNELNEKEMPQVLTAEEVKQRDEELQAYVKENGDLRTKLLGYASDLRDEKSKNILLTEEISRLENKKPINPDDTFTPVIEGIPNPSEESEDKPV